MWKRSDFETIGLLGAGVNTQVFHVVEKSSGTHLALKVISKRMVVESQAEHILRREIEIQYHLKSAKQL